MLTTEAERKRRYSICKKCPHLRAWTKTCEKCNCFMPVKTKIQEVSCPIGKWGRNSWGG
jgi:hypothetical protein